jgi:TP901 family phage tail tape measure protein
MNASLQTMGAKLTAVETKINTVASTVSTKVPAAGVAASNSFQKFNDTIGRTAQQLRSFGWLATTVLTVPIVMAVTKTIGAFKDFEYNMDKIIGLAGIAKKTTAEWGDSIKNMAKEVGQKPQDLADALYYVASAGFKTNVALDIVKQSAKGAAAGLGEVKTVADLVTSVMNAYGQGNITATRTLDILTAAVREGKGEADAMATSLGSVIPFAAQLGISFDQVAGSVAAMTLQGASAANAATYLRNIMMKLIHPAKQSEDALKEMGTSTAALRREIKEKGLLEGLMKLRQMTDQYGEEMMGKVIPNIRGMLGELMLTGKNFEYNQKVMDAVTDSAGSLAIAYEAVYMSTKMRLARATASLNTSLIDIGATLKQAVLPILEKWVERLKDLSDWYKNSSEGTQKFVTKTGGLLALSGPVTLLFSTFMWGYKGVASAVGSVIGKLIQLVKWAGVASESIGGMGEVVAVGGPYAALAALLGGAVWWTVKYKNNVVEAAKADDVLKKALVDVNGELKRLIDLNPADLDVIGKQDFTKLQQMASWAMKSVEMQKERVKYFYIVSNLEKGELEQANRTRLAWDEASDDQKLQANATIKKYNELGREFEKYQAILEDPKASEAEKKNAEKMLARNRSIYKDTMEIERGKLAELEKYAAATSIAVQGVMDDYSADAQDAADKAKAALIEGAFKPETTWKAMQEQINSINAVADAYKKMGLELPWDADKKKLDIYNDTLEQFIENGKSGSIHVTDLGERIKLLQQIIGTTGGVADKAFEDAKKALEDYKIDLATLSQVSKLRGPSFDIDTENLKVAENMLDKVVRNYDAFVAVFNKSGVNGIAATDALIKNLTTDIGSLNTTIGHTKDVERLNEFLSDVNGQLDKAARKFEIYGDAAKYSDEKTRIYNNAIEGLIDNFNGASVAIGGLVANFKDLADVASQTEVFKQNLELASEYFSIVSTAAETYQGILNNNKEKEIRNIEDVAKKHKASDQWLSAQREKIDKKYFKKEQNWAIAQALIDGALASMRAWATAKSWQEALAEQIVIAAETTAAIALISSQSFAKGGIVPSGYPNDSYPARLTSGEMVVPPGKLDNVMNDEDREVIFRIEGTTLVGVLENYNRKIKSFA